MSLSALSTSTSSSTRPTPPKAIVFDTRTSSSDCDDSRREPRGSSRMRWLPCGSVSCADAAYGLPLKYCRLAATTRPVRGTSTRAHDAEHVRAIVRQPAARVDETVRILPERQLSRAGDRADLRARSGAPVGGLQP